MPIPPSQRKLADALTALKDLQDLGKIVIKSSDLTRVQRESLVNSGFLQLIIKGWYMPSRPEDRGGISTLWFASMKDFIRGYCSERFGEDWHASPEYSLLLHAGATVLPKQIVIYSPKGKNGLQNLPEECSILDYQSAQLVTERQIELINGIRALPLTVALARVPEAFFSNYTRDAQIALHRVSDASEINHFLLEGGHSSVAGRLIGAFNAIGLRKIADDILATMQAAGYVINKKNPFKVEPPKLEFSRRQSPYVLRMRLMWKDMKETVVRSFPQEPGVPQDVERFMADIEERYQTDAYHSLSIEGYRVTDEIIRKVATGNWDPKDNDSDKQTKDAMAARGYWLAHNDVKSTIRTILDGANPGEAFSKDHGAWYRSLFAPNVDTGFLKPPDLAGYRSGQVFIRNALHVPPSPEAVRDMMPELCDLLEKEAHAAVRAVLGHFMFVYIHPYFDGNGRLARFLMNTMLASGGYPWTVIRLESRGEYMDALEAASSYGDIGKFADFVAKSMKIIN